MVFLIDLKMKKLIVVIVVILSVFMAVQVYELLTSSVYADIYSLVYMAVVLGVLVLRNRLTYFLGIVLMIAPFVYHYTFSHLSGPSYFVFTYPIYAHIYDLENESLYSFANIIYGFPRVFSILMVIIFLLPGFRKLYWKL